MEHEQTHLTIEKEIQALHARNKKVEADKTWETSFFRVCSLTIITYFLAYLFLTIIKAENAVLAAFVPAGGFVMSTLRANPLRKVWEKLQS